MKSKFISAALLAFLTVLSSNAQIFFRIEGNGLDKPSYLFGTHHFAPESMLDTLPLVLESLNKSTCVVGEMDMSVIENQMQLMGAMQPYMMAPADSTLSKLLPVDEYEKMDSVFAALTGGASMRMFDAMKPIVLETTLAAVVAAKEMPSTGQLDTYFQDVAKRENKKVAGLETPEFQAQVLFCTVPVSQQVESLKELLSNPDDMVLQLRKLTDAYLKRDADAIWTIGREASESSEGELFEVLLDKRNTVWLQKLPSMMKDDALFIAVGALHLYGDVGLVEGLKKQGYTVTPIL